MLATGSSANLTLSVPEGLMSSQMRWGDLVVAGDARRRELRERHGNGLDGVEVREGGRRLLVYFLEHAPRGLHPGNIRIEPLRAAAAPSGRSRCAARKRPDPEIEDHLIVELDHPGSAGPYLLRIVERRPDGTPGWRPYRGIDPRYAQARFVFDVDAPRAADPCGRQRARPPPMTPCPTSTGTTPGCGS